MSHDIGTPEGMNDSVDLAVSTDGTPQIDHLYTLPARCGMAVRLREGQRLTIVNPSGRQVCDFWAFAAENLTEHLSMAHLHTSLGSVFPKVGDALVSNRRRALLSIVEDTSPGVHDTIIANCDLPRYRQLGVEGYHDNCADNLRMALIAIGLRAPLIPAPFNIWMNVPLDSDGGTRFAPPVSSPGDRMTLRAEAAVIAVMSACPQDMTPVNGVGQSPDKLEFFVSDR